jgi:hypothetical protein
MYAQLAQWLERVIAVLSDITRSLVRVRHWALPLFSFFVHFANHPQSSQPFFTFYFFSSLFQILIRWEKSTKKKKITSVDAYLRTLYESEDKEEQKEVN